MKEHGGENAMEQAEKGQVKSLVKALELLDILSNKQAPMTLRELYQASGYPKSTIYALLSTLRAYGCIRQESDGRYYLGTKLFQWGCSVSASWDITRLARPYLERLARDTGSTALLSRVEGSSITVIDQCVSGAGIRVASEMGSHVSLYATSQGKLLLASLSDSAVRQLIPEGKLQAFTPHTLTDLPALLADLERIRTQGYAIENGEYKIGLRSVSAPVYSRENDIAYIVSAVGLFRRVESDEFDLVIRQTCDDARALSLQNGGGGCAEKPCLPL